jgi:hypothetical protein
MVSAGLKPPMVQMLNLFNEYTKLVPTTPPAAAAVISGSGSSSGAAERQRQHVDTDAEVQVQKAVNRVLSSALLPATAAIARLAHSPTLILPLVRVGALPPLIHLCSHAYYRCSGQSSQQASEEGELQQQKVDVMANVTLTLALLAAHDVGSAHAILAGAVPALLGVCQTPRRTHTQPQTHTTKPQAGSSGSPPSVGVGVGVLRDMPSCENTDPTHTTTTTTTTTVLQDVDSRVLCNAVSALADLSCHRPNIPSLVRDGAVGVLVDLLVEATREDVWVRIAAAAAAAAGAAAGVGGSAGGGERDCEEDGQGDKRNIGGRGCGHGDGQSNIDEEGAVAILLNVSLALSGWSDGGPCVSKMGVDV